MSVCQAFYMLVSHSYLAMSYPPAPVRLIVQPISSLGPVVRSCGMRTRVHALVLPSEVLGDFADEVRQIFGELGREYGLDTLAGECTPPIDVYETDAALEISVDLPGVDPTALRIL